MWALGIAAFRLSGCDGKPDNPCPIGKLPLTDTLFTYNEEFYDKPSRFVLFPKSKVRLQSGQGAAYMVAGPHNLLSRLATYQSLDSISLDFDHCIFKYHVFDITIRGDKIDYVSVTDSSILDFSESYAGGNLELRTTGHTTGQIRGAFDELILKNQSSMGLQVEAAMDRFILQHGGLGDVDAQAALPRNAWVWVNASGNVYLPEMDTIHATVNGAGTVYYRGDPYLDTVVNGSGSVKKME